MPNYFSYERTFDRRWVPVVFHGSRPSKTVNGSEPERTTFHEIPPELMGSDGESPLFAELMKKYPAPKELEA